MTSTIDSHRPLVGRPLSVLVSAALMVLTAAATMIGVGGFARPGSAQAASVAALAKAAGTTSQVGGERRQHSVVGAQTGSHRAVGWTSHQPDPAEASLSGASAPALAIEVTPQVAGERPALRFRAPHSGRAPPVGRLLV